MRKKIDIIISLLIIVFELYAFLRSILRNGRMFIEYYTVLSNLFAFLVSVLYLYFYKQRNRLVNKFYFITTCMMTLTFLVVFFILAPMYDFDYYWLMFKGSNLFMHTLCPALMIVNYIFFNKDKNKIYLPLIITGIYGIVLITLNLFKVVDGPYPFLKVYNQPLYMSFIWTIVLFLLNYGISFMLVKLNNKLKVD